MLFSKLFSKPSQYPIGLDISDLSLKLIQLNKIKGKIDIQAMGKIDLHSGLIENGEIKNYDETVKTIKKLVEKPKYGKITSLGVAACLPETKTFIKLIGIEKSPNNLEDVIETEMEKHIPFSMNEVFYDWQIIEDTKDKQLVLVGVTPKNIVNQYTNLIKDSGLSLEALEVEAIAICRSLLIEESPKFKMETSRNYGIIDIGAKRTSMVFYAKNTILFTVSMPISGEKITEQISKILKIERKQAEKAKLICGLDENKAQGVIKKILHDMINNLIEKIKQAMRYYYEHFPDHGDLNQIILCGGGANIKNLDEIIKQAVFVEVLIGNPLVNIDKNSDYKLKEFKETHKLLENFADNKEGKSSKTLTITQTNSSAFTTAIGLALRGLYTERF